MSNKSISRFFMFFVVILLATLPHYSNADKSRSLNVDNLKLPIVDKDINILLEDCPDFEDYWGCSEDLDEEVVVYIKSSLSKSQQLDTLAFQLGYAFEARFFNETYKNQFLNLIDSNKKFSSQQFAQVYMILSRSNLNTIKQKYCTKRSNKKTKSKLKVSKKTSKKPIKNSRKVFRACNYNKLLPYDYNLLLNYYQFEDLFDFIYEIYNKSFEDNADDYYNDNIDDNYEE